MWAPPRARRRSRTSSSDRHRETPWDRRRIAHRSRPGDCGSPDWRDTASSQAGQWRRPGRFVRCRRWPRYRNRRTGPGARPAKAGKCSPFPKSPQSGSWTARVGRVFRPTPGQAVIAAGHAFVARPQFVAALVRVTAVERPVLAIAPLEPARRLDVVGLVEKRADDASAEIELVRGAEAHRQPGVRPMDQVRALGDERVVALPIEAR